jgi:hypothetical protein
MGRCLEGVVESLRVQQPLERSGRGLPSASKSLCLYGHVPAAFILAPSEAYGEAQARECGLEKRGHRDVRPYGRP